LVVFFFDSVSEGWDMIGATVPDSFWEPVAVKRFDEATDRWTLEGLTGDEDGPYRLTVRHNNDAPERDNIRLTLNGDRNPANYEAVEAYMSADYTAGDRPLFDGLSRRSSLFETVWVRLRDALPKSVLFRLLDPGWRVIRDREASYMNFGKPLPGQNAVFGQGLLLTQTGGPRSLIRQCAETHPNGNLLTVGRYTYTNTEDVVTELAFTSGYPGGIGAGSTIAVETFAGEYDSTEER
jgi:hypothetical protein